MLFDLVLSASRRACRVSGRCAIAAMRPALIAIIIMAAILPAAAQRVGQRDDYRYVIVTNRVSLPIGPTDVTSRHLVVLAQSGNFNEKNLTLLFERLQCRFPDPATMSVQLFTSLEDVETPEEADGKTSESSRPPSVHTRAVFLQGLKKAFFYMYDGGRLVAEVPLSQGCRRSK